MREREREEKHVNEIERDIYILREREREER